MQGHGCAGHDCEDGHWEGGQVQAEGSAPGLANDACSAGMLSVSAKPEPSQMLRLGL